MPVDVDVKAPREPYPSSAVWLMWLGALWGQLTVPGAAWFPTGRLMRALYATAWVESAMNPDAVGDAGASIGILQFNVVRVGLVSRDGWRKSAFWSGVGAVRYIALLDTADVWALLKPGLSGLAAWRSYWRAGSVVWSSYEPDVSLAAWEGAGWWSLTVVQYAGLVAGILTAPVVVVPFVLYQLGGLLWALSGVSRVQ